TPTRPTRHRSPHNIKPDPAMAVSYTTSADVTERGVHPDLHRLLTNPQERGEFDALLRLAERIHKTLPKLGGLIDPGDAAKLLAESVWDAATILARKQEIRAVRDDLKGYALRGSEDVSRARLDLLNQQQRASVLWTEVNEELDRLRSHLTAAAVAGEAYVRDRNLDDTLERTEKALAKLSAENSIESSTAATQQLADQTTAVVQAYRELNELYGGRR
ncbi:hypothetical protein ABTW87_20195, partial [Micromonospora sp. NPDC126480]